MNWEIFSSQNYNLSHREYNRFLFLMQIFLCFYMIFHRLFLMNHVKKYRNTSFWQSETWRNILISSGQAIRVETFIYDEETICIEFRTIGLGQIGAFSLGVDPSLCSEAFFSLWKNIARQYGTLFWQIEYIGDAQISSDIQIEEPYRQFIEPYTRVLDLTLDSDALYAQMHEKWRYNIRLAERRWVSVEWIEATSENIDIWMRLLNDTTTRDWFAHNSREYYESFLQPSDIVKLAFAYYEWNIIAAGIFVYTETEAIYYYGASLSDKEMRKHMAPYLLQWFAILEGKSRWCIQYDFLGIATPSDTESHLAGVTSFKEKFGWSIMKLGPKILFPLWWKYRIFSLIRKIKNRGR